MTDMNLLNRIPDAIIVVSGDQTIDVMNKAAERLTGWTSTDASGKPWGDVLRLRDRTGRLVHDSSNPFTSASSLATGSPEREYMLHRRNGDDRLVAMRTSFERDDAGNITAVIASLRDSGRRHRTERSAYDLIATLAHDLRSPLTSVKGFTSTILRNWDRFSDEQKQHMLKTIDWDADRMNRLLSDLLDLSRLESGRLMVKGQEVEMDEIVMQVVERVDMEASNHQVSADLPATLPKVWADPGKIEQVLVNLVENAVKHGDPGAVVVSGEVVGDRVRFRVADSGPGIEERHLPYVFTKFYRKGTGERHAGTGLGLYIVKGIVDAHGGSIRVERSSPAGTIFAFDIPIEGQA